jgi:hypothetical protein
MMTSRIFGQRCFSNPNGGVVFRPKIMQAAGNVAGGEAPDRRIVGPASLSGQDGRMTALAGKAESSFSVKLQQASHMIL